MDALAGAKAVLPAQALLFEAGTLGFRADVLVGVGSAMDFAKCVPTSNKGDRFYVIHCHARKRLANVSGRTEWIGIAVGTLGVHVDQAHLNRADRWLQLPVARVALVSKPGVFMSPVDVFFRFPDIRASAAETKRLKAH